MLAYPSEGIPSPHIYGFFKSQDVLYLKISHLSHWSLKSWSFAKNWWGIHLGHSFDKIKVLALCEVWSLDESFSWSITFLLSFELSWFKGLLNTFRRFEVLKLDWLPPNTWSKIRVLSKIRISSDFSPKLDFTCFYMLLDIYEWNVKAQFWVEASQLITRGKMVILVKISQSQELTKWTFGQPSIQISNFHFSWPNSSLNQESWRN